MFDGLYLLHDDTQDRWQVRLEDTYYCVASVIGVEALIECIKKLVRKYKTEMKLRDALLDTDSRGQVGKNESIRQAELFKLHGHEYKALLKRAVKEALEEMKGETPVLKNRKSFKKVDLHKEDYHPTTELRLPLPKERSTGEGLKVTIDIKKTRPILGVRKVKM